MCGIFRLSIAGGSHHTYDTRIGYSGSNKNVSYALNTSKRHTGGYLPNAENDKLYFDGKIKSKTSNKSSLMLSGYYSDMDSEIANSIDPITGETLTTNINWSINLDDIADKNKKRSIKITTKQITGITKGSNRATLPFGSRVIPMIDGHMM
jgi:hypothetical protein